jgi:Domain of unknown function (DUF2017)
VRVSRRRSVTRLTLEPFEAELLIALLDQLEQLVEAMAADDAPTRRLFPAGHRDDPQAAAEFRELTELSLREGRRQRYGLMRTELPAGGGVTEITGETSQMWLAVLNDMRLALGTRLGISGDEPVETAPDDPDHGAHAVYHWLTALQDSLVRAAMR